MGCINAFVPRGSKIWSCLFSALVMTILSLAVGQNARADAFVMRVFPYPDDPSIPKLPIIQVDDAGFFLLDSGQSVGLSVTPEAAAAMGLNVGAGTPSMGLTAGGSVPVVNNVPVPPLSPSGASQPHAPSPQANQNFTLPDSATVQPALPGLNGIIGSDVIKNEFNSGFLDGPNGEFLYLSRKDQGAAGARNALNIAIQQAGLSAVPTGPDGRPVGTLNQTVTPLDLGGPFLNGGVLLSVTVGNASDVPFLISSGLPTTLISAATAQSLGLDIDALSVTQTLGNVGPINVHQASLPILLFNGISFTVPVGVTDSTTNPAGLNFLGRDVLSQFSLTEISTAEDGSTRFYAAPAVPEPSTWMLLAVGGLCIVLTACWYRKSGPTC